MDELTARTVAVAWRRAGKKLGLSGPGLFVGLRLDGFVGPFGVRVEQQGDRTRIVVHDERPSALSGLHWRAAPGQIAADPVVATGDVSFDDRVVAHGDPILAAAFFSAPMRRLILGAMAGGGRFEEGVLSLDVPRPPGSTTALVSAIRAAVALARRMTRPRDRAACLTSNALRDPVPAVRLNCLERLCESFPKRAARVLRVALRDPDPAVRLRAATALPKEGRRALLSLATSLRLDENVQAQAIAALVRPPAREMSHVLVAAIKRGRRRVALEAIAALGFTGSRSALARLAPLTGSGDAGIRTAAIRALGATRQPGAQASLVRALTFESSEDREAAAEALGALGTVTAVAPLRAAVEAHPLDLGLRRIAGLAIESIQARASGAERGQLSIADQPGVGGLSLAASEAGQLSLSPASAPAERLDTRAGTRGRASSSSWRRR
jgi:HEAT repeat protein